MKNRSIRRGIVPVLAALVMVSAGLISRSGDPAAVAAAATEQPAADSGASYARVAPILQARCASCHNPQGGAPFNLLTYEDAKQWSGQILEVTQSRYMPPWLPAPGKGDFAGERRLSDAELTALREWVGAGAAGPAETSPGEAGAAAPEPSEWPLGKPDAVLTLPEPVTVPGKGADVFTNLVVPYTGDQTRSLRAIQIRPSDPQAVRGVLLSIDESGRLRQSDGWRQGIVGMEPPEDITAGRVRTDLLVSGLAGAEAADRAKLDVEAGKQSAVDSAPENYGQEADTAVPDWPLLRAKGNTGFGQGDRFAAYASWPDRDTGGRLVNNA